MSNKEIGEKLYISDGTVRNYVTGLLEKLNLRDRTQLAIFYVKNF
jgi:DNA-binding NarL/FixJ family response regulator